MSARDQLSSATRIVVKLGTHVVTHDGVELALGRLNGLVEDLASLQRAGKQVILVSSGAVGMGMRALALSERPASLGLRQACAAVGQGQMMGVYTGAFGQLGVTTAQVLLIQEDLADRDRALCLRTTLMRLLELGALPILNENDSVSVREIVDRTGADGASGFGDNDGLSARVAVALDADVLVLLTDVDGMFDRNPRHHDGAQRIAEIARVDDEVMARATGESIGGTGGMTSKLEAARIAADAGAAVLIASGDTPRVVSRALSGEDLGTLVLPAVRRKARDRHIAVDGKRSGAMIVNEGAIEALTHHKASLLPIGVVSVEGEFVRGDVVEIRDRSGRVHGRGLANYDSKACRSLAGRHSSDIASVLGFRGYDALVSRDNLVWGDV